MEKIDKIKIVSQVVTYVMESILGKTNDIF